jgi:hypothetical protein
VGSLLLTRGIKTHQQNASRTVQLSSSTDATLFTSGLQFLTQRIEGRRTKTSTRTFDRTPLSLLKSLSHKDINGLGETVLDHSHGCMCAILRRLKASHSKEHTNSSAPCHTGARLLARMTLHVSTPAHNHTHTVIPRARLYKGEIASPSRYTTLYTTLLKHFSQFHY